mgnify:CR=1 FL=1
MPRTVLVITIAEDIALDLLLAIRRYTHSESLYYDPRHPDVFTFFELSIAAELDLDETIQ